MKKFFLIFTAIFFSTALSLFAQEVGTADENVPAIENSETVENEPEIADETEIGQPEENEEYKENDAVAENTEETPNEEETEQKQKNRQNPFVSRFNQRGDQYIKIGLMGVFPLNFGGDFPLFKEGQVATGGSGELGYHRFFSSWFAIGADIAFGYNPTLENNIFTWVPLFVTVTVQPTIYRVEIPITVGVGMAYETYLKNNYFPGLVIKPEIGIFYRVSPGWSFGLETQFMIMPQTYSDTKYNFTGFFETFGICARYHF